MNRERLGESLVKAGFITIEQLNYALTLKAEKFHAQRLGQILMDLNYVDEDILIEFLGKQYGTPSISLSKEVINEEAIDIIPRHIAEKYKVISVGFKLEGGIKKLVVAMADPSNLEIIHIISFMTGYSIEPIFAMEEDFKWVIRYYYNKRDLFYPKRDITVRRNAVT